MKEIRFVCDLDGVVFDFNSHFINLAREVYPHCKVPDASNHYPDEWNYMLKHLPKAKESMLWELIIKSQKFWATCPTYAHSAELLTIAQANADKLYFLTSRSGKRVQEQTVKALNSVPTGPKIHGGVIAVPRAEMKLPIINALNATHFLDDKPETIQESAIYCVNTKIGLWDQPWNRSQFYPPAVTRLHNLKELDEWLS